MDILNRIKEQAVLQDELEDKLDDGVIVSFSFSSLDEKLAKIIEPGAPKPVERLKTMKKYSDAGFNTGIINMPVLPFLSDSDKEIETMIKSAKKYGANYVLYSGLTLYGDDPDDCNTLYFNFLNENYPNLVHEYENLFKGSNSSSKRYQRNLDTTFRGISNKYAIKNSII